MRFDDKIKEVLGTLDEAITPAGAAPTQPAPASNNQQAPVNQQQVPPQGQQQQPQQQPQWTPEQVLQAALQADPNKFKDVDPKSKDYFAQVATRLMTPQQQQGQQPPANGVKANPAAASNPTTTPATPASTNTAGV